MGSLACLRGLGMAARMPVAGVLGRWEPLRSNGARRAIRCTAVTNKSQKLWMNASITNTEHQYDFDSLLNRRMIATLN
jgi:hypothetical protein